MTTCLNFWNHQLVNICQKALNTVQWYSRRSIVCFSVAHKEQISLSVMPARKRLDLVGKMWWIILIWKAINCKSLVIKKGNEYSLLLFKALCEKLNTDYESKARQGASLPDASIKLKNRRSVTIVQDTVGYIVVSDFYPSMNIWAKIKESRRR